MRKYLIITAFFGLPGIASSAPIEGSVDVSPQAWVEADTPKPPGYVRLPVTAPASAYERRVPTSALFLQVVESLPITPPEARVVIRLEGGRLSPEVVACAVDEKLSFLNGEDQAVQIRVGDHVLVPVERGESVEWSCTASSQGATMKPIRVEELPWVRASVFVGEVGVAVRPGRDGRFSLEAPKGRYKLLWIGREGILAQRELTVDDRAVQVRPFLREEASAP
ncbi:MAG: hypothetical protein AAGD10_19800 [Myxococcota bacterium]